MSIFLQSNSLIIGAIEICGISKTLCHMIFWTQEQLLEDYFNETVELSGSTKCDIFIFRIQLKVQSSK